jgi:hypothetical protein
MKKRRIIIIKERQIIMYNFAFKKTITSSSFGPWTKWLNISNLPSN